MRGIFGLRGKGWFGIEIYITCHGSPVLELQARWGGGVNVGLAAELRFGVKNVKMTARHWGERRGGDIRRAFHTSAAHISRHLDLFLFKFSPSPYTTTATWAAAATRTYMIIIGSHSRAVPILLDVIDADSVRFVPRLQAVQFVVGVTGRAKTAAVVAKPLASAVLEMRR